ncbi:MAG TPA: glutathione S-transferase N-terminal domain-containing protein [Polyangiales bacterium]
MLDSFTHQAAVVGSIVSSTFGAWRGSLVLHAAKQPPLPITLYDFEGCPYCRKVREALTALHLDVEIKPCPRNGTRFRPEAERIGGKLMFPLLVDPNTDTVMYESIDIVAYLFRSYGRGKVPGPYRRSAVQPLFDALQFAARGARGILARPSRAPDEPLHLWSFEGSPYSRLVRERLTELELPYTLHNLGKEHWKEAGPPQRRLLPNPYVPREGGKRYAFWQAHQRVQVPYLEDPNTGAGMFESAEIIAYLERTYALPLSK